MRGGPLETLVITLVVYRLANSRARPKITTLSPSTKYGKAPERVPVDEKKFPAMAELWVWVTKANGYKARERSPDLNGLAMYSPQLRLRQKRSARRGKAAVLYRCPSSARVGQLNPRSKIPRQIPIPGRLHR